MDYTGLPTPEKCTADFCLIPVSTYLLGSHHLHPLTDLQMGTASASVSAQIADVQRLIEQSGVKYTMHSAGTTLGTYSLFTAIYLGA